MYSKSNLQLCKGKWLKSFAHWQKPKILVCILIHSLYSQCKSSSISINRKANPRIKWVISAVGVCNYQCSFRQDTNETRGGHGRRETPTCTHEWGAAATSACSISPAIWQLHKLAGSGENTQNVHGSHFGRNGRFLRYTESVETTT